MSEEKKSKIEEKKSKTNDTNKNPTFEKEGEMFDKDRAIFDPSNFFKSPMDIVSLDKNLLTKKEKLDALFNWELECRLQEIGDDENMPIVKNKKKTKITTADVHSAREALGDIDSEVHGSTSKIGMAPFSPPQKGRGKGCTSPRM